MKSNSCAGLKNANMPSISKQSNLLYVSIASLFYVGAAAALEKQPTETGDGAKYARCAGSTEMKQCRELVDSLAAETPEAKRARVERLEQGRRAGAQEVVRSSPNGASQAASDYANWSYDQSIDEMTSKTTKSATLKSNNSLDLSFPYSGDNFGRLIVRRHPTYGLDVILTVSKGQILCSSYAGCPIKVRFDDGKPVSFNGKESADHDSTVVFLGSPQRFIAQASKAKRILVQVNMYQAGAPVLEFFSSSPLLWANQK